MGDDKGQPISLLTPYKMGAFQLSKRMIYGPLTRSRALNTIPCQAAITYYTQRASEGLFMLTEANCIAVEGHGYPHTPGIYTPAQLEAWKPIVKAVKDKGTIFFCQIWHVGRASHSSYQPNGGAPVGPSALPVADGKVYTAAGSVEDYPIPRALEIDEIATIVEQYRVAARNALAVGFDGVEIHAANGYLIDQFLKDGINKRTDKYGGPIENRARFCLEVVDAVVKEVGADKVGIRLSPYGGFLDAHDSDVVGTHGYLVERLSERGLLYLHCVEPRVGGNTDREVEEGHTIANFRKLFKNTFIAAGGYKRESGIEAIDSGHADLVCYGRLFLANPDLPRRFELNAPLNKYDRNTFYTQDPVVGYTDYPFLDENFGK